MKKINPMAILIAAVLSLNIILSSCNKEDDEVVTSNVTTCTVTNQISGTTLRDVNAIHVNSRHEEIKSEYIGDIPYGSSKTFTCIGVSVYFRLNINGKTCFTADTDLKENQQNSVIIDGNTYVYY